MTDTIEDLPQLSPDDVSDGPNFIMAADEAADEIREKMRKGELLQALQIEVQRYIDKPGCNIPAQATAMKRLAWALKESKK